MPQPPYKDADKQSRYIYAVDDGKTKEQEKMDQWEIVYVKEYKNIELKKGDTNSDFGLRVDTDFYIVSQLPRGRYIDLVSNDCKLKVSNGRTS
jgi:hypothetical protein